MSERRYFVKNSVYFDQDTAKFPSLESTSILQCRYAVLFTNLKQSVNNYLANTIATYYDNKIQKKKRNLVLNEIQKIQ